MYIETSYANGNNINWITGTRKHRIHRRIYGLTLQKQLGNNMAIQTVTTTNSENICMHVMELH